jgi:hypothetical protein
MPVFGAMGGVTIKPLGGLAPISPPMGSQGPGVTPPADEFLLLESGDFFLLEDGVSKIVLEA